jgi:pyrimidine deaminase RibD-like protein
MSSSTSTSIIALPVHIPTPTHLHYLQHALSIARLSPPKPTNFCVGALLVSFPSAFRSTTNHCVTFGEEDPTTSGIDTQVGLPQIMATGYTLELEGNTHAEQCCLDKFAAAHGKNTADLPGIFAARRELHRETLVLYTTMAPCVTRLSGAVPCTDRILAASGIDIVVVGVGEPETFVDGAKTAQGQVRLEKGGVRVVRVEGLDEEILKVAKAGHVDKGS